MELEEAIEWLKNNIKYYQEQLKIISVLDGSDYYDEEQTLYEKRIKIFQTVLNHIENSIPREVIEKKIEELETTICGNDEYLGNKQCIELELLRKVEEELLGVKKLKNKEEER